MCVQHEQTEGNVGKGSGDRGEATEGKGVMPDWEEVEMPPTHVLSHRECLNQQLRLLIWIVT